jgi:hypothetical protein
MNHRFLTHAVCGSKAFAALQATCRCVVWSAFRFISLWLRSQEELNVAKKAVTITMPNEMRSTFLVHESIDTYAEAEQFGTAVQGFRRL